MRSEVVIPLEGMNVWMDEWDKVENRIRKMFLQNIAIIINIIIII